MTFLRSRIPVLLVTLALLSLGAIPSRAANGVVAMNWDGCTGPVTKSASAPGVFSIYVSVLGIDIPHKAYDIKVYYGDEFRQVPDAWRFDEAGCQGAGTSALLIDPRPPFTDSETCPAFMGNAESVIQIKQIGYPPPSDPFPSTLIRMVLVNAYPNGVSSVDPLTRYHLGRFMFDHYWSVEGTGTPGLTCGGLETPICFKLLNAVFLDMNGNEIPFDRTGPTTITMNDAQSTSCAAFVPARPTTWGRLKRQYRD
jgi:hypothetical protein